METISTKENVFLKYKALNYIRFEMDVLGSLDIGGILRKE